MGLGLYVSCVDLQMAQVRRLSQLSSAAVVWDRLVTADHKKAAQSTEAQVSGAGLLAVQGGRWCCVVLCEQRMLSVWTQRFEQGIVLHACAPPLMPLAARF